MIEKPEDKQVIKENCISMVQCKALKQLEFIEQKKFEDEDIQADIEFLKEKMEISLQDLRYTGIMNRMKSCDILLNLIINSNRCDNDIWFFSLDSSSYDEYITEVRSGRLEWSPVHRSEKFWRENAAKLNDRNYELLKILINLLETSKDLLVLSVACFDLGEYVRHYQRGKQ